MQTSAASYGHRPKIRGLIFISRQLKQRLTFFTLPDACHDLASDSKVSNGIRDATKKQVQNKVQLLLKIVLMQPVSRFFVPLRVRIVELIQTCFDTGRSTVRSKVESAR